MNYRHRSYGDAFDVQIVYSVLDVELMSSAAATALDMSSVTTIRTTESVWMEVVLGKTQAAVAYQSGALEVSGSLQDVRTFLSYF
jgi:hypothetical protein